MVRGENRIERDGFQATVNPIDTNGVVFVAEMEMKDADSKLTPRELARVTGALAFELMQTSAYEEIGGPFQAMTVRGLPVFSPSELVEFASGDGNEVPDSLHLDYGFPRYMLATEDPNGHVHSLYPADFSHLPDSPGGWHTDLTFMPNRPTRTTLQAYVIGKTLRPGATTGQIRSTGVADGRWLLTKLEETVKETELDVAFNELYSTEFYKDSFHVEYERLRGKPLTVPITHPRIATSPTGERALTMRSFKNAHYANGQYLEVKVAEKLDTIVRELLASDELPKYEQLHREDGAITIISDRTPHHRGRAPHRETELRRVCVHDINTYVPQFKPEDINEVKPEWYVQPESIRDLEQDNYSLSMQLAEQHQFGDVDVQTVVNHFRSGCTKFYKNMMIMVADHPESSINVEMELVRYAATRGIPNIETTEDFLAFANAE